MVDGMAWLATMPASVERQRRLLELLLDAIARDPTYRWLELGCSLARGVGDEWSDIDAGVGVGGDTELAAAVDRTAVLVRTLAPVTDQVRLPLGDAPGSPATHVFTQYDHGLQLSLVEMPADARPGPPPDAVAFATGRTSPGSRSVTWRRTSSAARPGRPTPGWRRRAVWCGGCGRSRRTCRIRRSGRRACSTPIRHGSPRASTRRRPTWPSRLR